MLYADHNSSTAVIPAVFEAAKPFFSEVFVNPSSNTTPLGQKAEQAVENARALVAKLVQAKPEEIVFTSGGTESCHSAIFGAILADRARSTIISTAVEHPAVLETLKFTSRTLEDLSFKLIPVNRSGELNWALLLQNLEKQNTLLSLMAANNETGVCFPIDKIAQLAKEKRIAIHSDGIQAAGKTHLSFSKLGLDFLSISAHKIGGPKGVGALVIKEGSKWSPVVKGGGQERGLRGGTQAVPLIVAFGQAALIAKEILEAGLETKMRNLRDSFEQNVDSNLSDCWINGKNARRLPNTSSLCISGINAFELVKNLAKKNIYIATGSACKSSDLEPSHVLTAMGLNTFDSLATLRISFGPNNTEKEATTLAHEIAKEAERQRKQSKTLVKTRLIRQA